MSTETKALGSIISLVMVSFEDIATGQGLCWSRAPVVTHSKTRFIQSFSRNNTYPFGYLIQDMAIAL